MRVAQEQVEAFHHFTGQPAPLALTVLEPRHAEYRNFIMQSEMDELKDALVRGDLQEIADGGADAIYTILGTMVASGIRPDVFARIFEEVHRSNMTKTPNPKQGEFGAEKPLKGEGFQRPRIAELLLQQVVEP